MWIAMVQLDKKMENKTKAIALIAIIVAAVGLGVYFFKQKKVQPLSQSQQSQQQVAKNDPATQTQSQEVKAPASVIPDQLVGTLSMVDPKFLTIERVDGSTQLSVTADTKFFKKEKTTKTVMKAEDVKVGMNALLKIDTKTGEILEATIIL